MIGGLLSSENVNKEEKGKWEGKVDYKVDMGRMNRQRAIKMTELPRECTLSFYE